MAEQQKRAVDAWPSLRVEDWTETRNTLYMWLQIIGKVRMAHAPLVNHWWQTTLYVTARGLSTSVIHHAGGAFDVEFDFCDHQLRIRRGDGATRHLALEPMPAADFYTRTMRMLGDLGIEARIQARPNEVEPSIPFAEDHQHASYDPEAARLFWRQLVHADRVLQDGFADYQVRPPKAFYSQENGQFLLPYEVVRAAPEPDRVLLDFLHTTYAAAAERGGWDRAALEADPTRWDHKR